MAHLWLQVLPRGPGDRRRELQEAVMRHDVEKNPRDFWARLWLGALMLSRATPGDAEASLEQAVRINPKQPEGHNWLGLAYSSVGRSREAIAQFQMALALQSRSSARQVRPARRSLREFLRPRCRRSSRRSSAQRLRRAASQDEQAR